MRRLRSIVTLPLLLATPSCGACLLVQNQAVELQTVRGETVPVTVSFRNPDGLMSLETPGRRLWLGFLVEPFDWVLSTTVAIEAIFSDETDVAMGPIGWLCSLTPFATLFPTPQIGLPSTLKVGDIDLNSMRAGDMDAARSAFGDHRIHAVTYR